MSWCPSSTMFEHGVKDDEQLAHTGGEGDLFGFASSTETLVERLDNGVVTGSGEGSHIERGPDGGAPAPDGAPTSEGPTVAIERSNTYQSSDLVSIEGAELR